MAQVREKRYTANAKNATGSFCWAELATRDLEKASSFYADVFGWQYRDMPIDENNVYRMATIDDLVICALFESTQMPPNWMNYVKVDDVDAVAAKVEGLGGTLMKEPFDVMDAGRMAVVQDPTGAVFALWQAGRHTGADLIDVPGAKCWNELLTNDPKRAQQFYTQLLGWNVEAMPEMDYVMFKVGDTTVAGMMDSSSMDNVHPHWLVYFAVEDCDDAIATIERDGGNVTFGPQEIPSIGRFAWAQDPQGTHFAFIELADQQ